MQQARLGKRRISNLAFLVIGFGLLFIPAHAASFNLSSLSSPSQFCNYRLLHTVAWIVELRNGQFEILKPMLEGPGREVGSLV